MAANSGDFAGGFRHNEVVSFINNEVLRNGGGPDFYTTFRSQTWDEIEDRLRAVLTDPQTPRHRKRACTWSALTLGVRVAARQREQLVCQVQQLQDRVEELEGTAWGLAPELQRLREEREKMALQLHLAQATLQQALNECDVLQGQLYLVAGSSQVPLLTHEIVPGLQPRQLGAASWSLNEEQQRHVGAVGMPGSPWAQGMQPSLPMAAPYSSPRHPPFPVGFPFLPPLPPPAVFMEAEGAVMPPMRPPPGIYTSSLWAAVGAQEVMAPLWNLRSPSQGEGPETLQGTFPIGDFGSLSQKLDLERPQGVVNLSENKNYSLGDRAVGPQGLVPLGNSWCHTQEQHLERSQGMDTMGDSRNNSLEEGPERPQNMLPQGASWSHVQEESSERPQGMVPIGESKSHCQEEDPERSQGDVFLGSSSSQSQEGDSERPQGNGSLEGSSSQSQEGDPQMPQETFLGASNSLNVRENPKKQQFQGQKAKQTKVIRTSESQHQEMSASLYSPDTWGCPWCMAVNFQWRKFCFRCRKFALAVERINLGPRQSPFRRVRM